MNTSIFQADWMYALALTLNDDDPDKPRMLHVSGFRAMEQYEKTSNLEDLQLAIDAYQAAMVHTPDLTPTQVNLLEDLGKAFYLRWKTIGSLDDLSSSCFYRELLVSLTPDTDVEKPDFLNDLGNALQARFDLSGDFEDLETVVGLRERALDLTRGIWPPVAEALLLNNLGNSLEVRFRFRGNIADLEAAIDLKRKSVSLLPNGHPSKPTYLSNLGSALGIRFKVLHDLEDLRAAVKAQQDAVRLSPERDRDQPFHCLWLGIALLSQFEYTGSAEDLEASIRATRRSVELFPDGDPEKPGAIGNLGNAFESKFQLLGQIEDLDLSVKLKQKAVELTPSGHPDMSASLNNLGNVLESRYERLGHVEDLKASMKAKQESVALTPDLHTDKPGRLINLGSALEAWFSRSHDIADLEKAIEVKQAAVDATPVGSPLRSQYLSSLGTTVMTRFRRLEELTDLDKALAMMQEAVELSPDGFSHKAKYLNNLGTIWMVRYRELAKVEDLEKALKAAQEAVRLADNESLRDKAVYFNGLAELWAEHWEASADQASLKGALSFATKAAQHTTSDPQDRLAGAVIWINTATQCDNVQEQLAAFSVAIQLIPELVWFGLDIKRQYEELNHIPKIVRMAVATTLKAGDPELALEWLEQGRSVVWGQTLQLRSPIDALLQRHPDLANQFIHITRQLEARRSGQEDMEGSGERLREFVLKRDQLLQRIRTQEGFESFLGPKRITDLRRAAKFGPVITLSVHHSGCDALILLLDLDEVMHVELPDMVYDKATELWESLEIQQQSSARGFAFPTRAAGRPADGTTTIRHVLSELWNCVVKPVLDALGFSPTDARYPPRVWWCPTGPLAFLPIHAAGLYDSDELGTKVFDYVVSSYTPTVTALLETPRESLDRVKILAVAQPNVPGQSALPATIRELEILRNRAAENQLTIDSVDGKFGTVERVLSGMKECSWVHFACHGTQNLAEPTQSALLLVDGNLELAQIIKHPLQHAEFAFLSACQTASGDMKLEDEAVHLAAGMLLAGYRSVVATMWAIMDQDGPLVADWVYEEMLRDGKPDHTRAAHALHLAVKQLRDSGAPLLSWMPFIHFGA